MRCSSASRRPIGSCRGKGRIERGKRPRHALDAEHGLHSAAGAGRCNAQERSRQCAPAALRNPGLFNRRLGVGGLLSFLLSLVALMCSVPNRRVAIVTLTAIKTASWAIADTDFQAPASPAATEDASHFPHDPWHPLSRIGSESWLPLVWDPWMLSEAASSAEGQPPAINDPWDPVSIKRSNRVDHADAPSLAFHGSLPDYDPDLRRIPWRSAIFDRPLVTDAARKAGLLVAALAPCGLRLRQEAQRYFTDFFDRWTEMATFARLRRLIALTDSGWEAVHGRPRTRLALRWRRHLPNDFPNAWRPERRGDFSEHL